MSPHVALAYEFLVIGVGIAALVAVAQRARRSGRPDHRSFAVFWGGYLLPRPCLF